MAAKKTIAIVGATQKTGTEIANQFSFTDNRLLLVSNDVNQLALLSKNIADNKPKAEIDSIECVKDGCWEADIIVLAVPLSEEVKVAELMKEVATQKIVVIVSDEKNTSNDLQKILPNSKLVTVSNISQSKEIFIAGDDDAANEEIAEIFNQAGYHPEIKESLSSI